MSGEADLGAWLLGEGAASKMMLMWRRPSTLSIPFTLASVLLLQRRVKSVADVLKGIRQNGFSQGRWDALLGRWKSCCDQVPCGPLRSLEHWVHWIPPDEHGFFQLGFLMIWECLMTSLGRWWWLVGILVFVAGPTGCGRIWELGLMPGSGPTLYLLLPSLISVIRWPKLPRSWLSLIFFMLSFRQAWMPFFCRSGHPLVAVYFIARGRSRNHGRRPSFLLLSRKAGATSDLSVRNSQFMKSRHDWMQCDDKCFAKHVRGVLLAADRVESERSLGHLLLNPQRLQVNVSLFTQSSSLGGRRVAVQLQFRTTPKSCINPW